MKKANINVSTSRTLALTSLERSTPVSEIVIAGGHSPEYESYSSRRARGSPQKSPERNHVISISASIVRKANINVSTSRTLALSSLERSTPVSAIVIAGGHPPEYESYSSRRARSSPQKSPPYPLRKLFNSEGMRNR